MNIKDKDSVMTLNDISYQDEDVVAHLFQEVITRNRELADCEFAAGRITELTLNTRHQVANRYEELAKRLFTGWRQYG